MISGHFDYILVGGGLQSGLLTLAIKHYQPEASILLVERCHRLAGNHTWSFHPDDVPTAAQDWLAATVEYRWPHYQIRVGGVKKDVALSYASISSEFFAEVVTGSLGNDSLGSLRINTEVTELSERAITTAVGERLTGRLVIDCRGPNASTSSTYSQCGFQKFWGFELALTADWPFDGPVVMDDQIDQTDGFRFIYSLPFEPRRVLVEDTRFANSHTLDRSECLQKVTQYLASLGINDWSILREENGVLPMPITSENMPGAMSRTQQDPSGDAIRGGYCGGWFHAATGYSFPLAVAFAETVARTTPELASAEVARLAVEHRARSTFGRFLNRLLFRLVRPSSRRQIFGRFYRVLSNDSIARFYSHRFNWRDAFRIVVGWPPSGLQPLLFLRSFLDHSTSSAIRNPDCNTSEIAPNAIEEVNA